MNLTIPFSGFCAIADKNRNLRDLVDFSATIPPSLKVKWKKIRYINPEFIQKMKSSFEKDESTYYGDNLWVFLILEMWLNKGKEIKI